jgi:hypothetical protein
MNFEKKIKALIFGAIFIFYNIFLIAMLQDYPTLQGALVVYVFFIFLFIWLTKDQWSKDL